MPIYEYVCADCGQISESLRKMADADEPIACEKCGSEQTHRRQSVFAAAGGERDDVSLPMSGEGGGCPCGDPAGPCNI